MSQESRLTVGGALWSVALATLLVASLTARPSAANLVSLAAVGGGLTVLALVLDARSPAQPVETRGRRFTLTVLAVALGLEVLGILFELLTDDRRIALWFGLAAGFSMLGMAAAWRRVSGDGIFAAQIAFHAVLLQPLIVPFVGSLAWALSPTDPADLSLERRAMAVVLYAVAIVEVPLLMVQLATVLAYHQHRPVAERDRGWAVLVAHQTIFLLALERWVMAGW